MSHRSPTRRQAADRLDSSLRSLDRWVASGLLRPLRVGRVVRFAAADLDTLLGSGAVAQEAAK